MSEQLHIVETNNGIPFPVGGRDGHPRAVERIRDVRMNLGRMSVAELHVVRTNISEHLENVKTDLMIVDDYLMAAEAAEQQE